MKKKILITGGAGFIGSMLSTKLVAEGYEVTVVDQLNYNKSSLDHLFFYKNFKFYKMNILNFNSLNKIIKKTNLLYPWLL